MDGEKSVFRNVYRAELRAGAEAGDVENLRDQIVQLESRVSGEILTASLFKWKETLFLYVEGIGSAPDPHSLFNDADTMLAPWPGDEKGSRYWVPMMDIFHYNQIKDLAQWRRKAPVEKAFGRVIRLRPEMVSSYIFYHYQLQEEKPGRRDKYGMITIHENLLFFYQEDPSVIEDAPFPGKLNTSNTPSGWQELMGQHFEPWTDPGEEVWRPIELVASVGLPA